MKVFLYLCLFALLSCKMDFWETAVCVISKPKVQEVGLKVFNHVLTKEFNEIWQTLVTALPELQKSVLECLSGIQGEEDEVILKNNGCKHWTEYLLCSIPCGPINNKNCLEGCYRGWCA